MVEDVGVGAAGFFEGVGQDGQAVEGPIIVDALGQLDDRALVPVHWGHRGLAFSTACIATTNFLVLYLLMRKELGRFHTLALASLTVRVGAASGVMAAVCLASTRWLLPGWERVGFWLRLAWLLGTIVVAAVVFAACTSALKVSELTDDHGGLQAPPGASLTRQSRAITCSVSSPEPSSRRRGR